MEKWNKILDKEQKNYYKLDECNYKRKSTEKIKYSLC